KESGELHRQALEKIEPMSMSTVENILNQESPLLYEGSHIENEFLCASLGQVCHLIKDNQDIAVKIQYPDSGENMQMDGRAMDLMTRSFKSFSRGFDMSDYDRVIKNELSRELDYCLELEMQNEFFRIFSDNNDIVIPLSLKKYSSKKCLAMSWEPSISLDHFLKIASDSQRKDASGLIVEFYMQSIFKHGLLHSDPNPGNFGFRLFGDKVQLVVYDFGSVVKLDRDKHMLLLSLLDFCLNKQNPFPVLRALGFKEELLKPIADKLPVLLSILLEPFLSEGAFEYSSWNRKEKVNDILGEKRWNFMAAAPAELFLFMRSLSGLFYYTEKLSGKIFCRSRLTTILHSNSKSVSEVKEKLVADYECFNDETSSHLIISVRESGAQKVKLTLPAKSVESLKNFIPPDVETKLIKQKINIDDLVLDVRRNSYKPQTVFSLVEETKEVSVYLE
ncbi:MAG: AarF/UbiB family protein, partial [Lentisphaeraceae bacterium]|nr:AarF/UbiB family protein [Lentisphaeraceae bacterium]